MEVRLTIVGGKANRKVVTLQLPAIIGRSREANLTIAHPMVSRRHCELFEMQGLVRIRDLGSLNGTLVGGKEITEAPLRPNDEFSIGPLTFRVEYDYGGDVTVVAPVVPEESPEPVPVPPVPPPIGGDLPPFFRLSAAQAPQAPPASRDAPAEEAAGPWGRKQGLPARKTCLPPSPSRRRPPRHIRRQWAMSPPKASRSPRRMQGTSRLARPRCSPI